MFQVDSKDYLFILKDTSSRCCYLNEPVQVNREIRDVQVYDNTCVYKYMWIFLIITGGSLGEIQVPVSNPIC